MVVYFCLYVLFGACAICEYKKIPQSAEKAKKISVLLCFLGVLALLALRHPSMGVDLQYGSIGGYIGSFHKIAGMSWKDVFALDSFMNYEKGYVLLNKLVGSIFQNTQFFLAIVAFLTVGPIFGIIKKYSMSPVFSSIVYMGLPVFLLGYSGLRQCIAIGICFWSLKFIKEKKLIKFIIAVVIAACFHTSALAFIIAYPAYHIRVGKRLRIVSVALLPLIWLFRNQLFTVLTKLIGKNVKPDDNNAITLFLVFTAIYIFCIMYSKKEHNGYLNLFYIACAIQAMGGVHALVMRVGYYYMIILAILLPNLILSIDSKRTKVFYTVVTSGCFVVYGLYAIYSSSWSETYPYYFFWQ